MVFHPQPIGAQTRFLTTGVSELAEISKIRSRMPAATSELDHRSGRKHLVMFRADWAAFTAAVDGVLGVGTGSVRGRRLRPAARDAT
jgi:hypothetical protein